MLREANESTKNLNKKRRASYDHLQKRGPFKIHEEYLPKTGFGRVIFTINDYNVVDIKTETTHKKF